MLPLGDTVHGEALACDIWELQHCSELEGCMTFSHFWQLICPRLCRNSAERRWGRWKQRLSQTGIPIEQIHMLQKKHTDKFGNDCTHNGNGNGTSHSRVVLRLGWSKLQLDDYLTRYQDAYYRMPRLLEAARRISMANVVCGHRNKAVGIWNRQKKKTPPTCQVLVVESGQRYCWRHRNGNGRVA